MVNGFDYSTLETDRKQKVPLYATARIADTNSINDCNTSLGKDAMHRISTNGLFVAFFFPIGMTTGFWM
ncbi:MAG: hypothetical protein V7K77_27690 [Nostoc sp.]|uniref:hypothetical protein n=1 Tax=Nostoc sp. TaxID=1180 RepID=UPI002FF5CBFB